MFMGSKPDLASPLYLEDEGDATVTKCVCVTFACVLHLV